MSLRDTATTRESFRTSSTCRRFDTGSDGRFGLACCQREISSRYYRVDLVIEAFARFSAEVPAATLTVAGYGSEESRLRGLAASLGGDAIRFAGKIDPAAMPQLYAQHDIFVSAAVLDNQPVSILEAFAAGLPVVSTVNGRHSVDGAAMGRPACSWRPAIPLRWRRR